MYFVLKLESGANDNDSQYRCKVVISIRLAI